MTQISFKFDPKAKLVRKGLENLRLKVPQIARSRIFDSLKRVVAVMQRYPPPRPMQRYKRTFKLKRGWRILRKGPTGYTILNRASYRGRAYPKYVVGDAKGGTQAWMHVGRWRLLRWEMEAEFEKQPKAIANNIHFFARRNGFRAGGG